MCVYIVYTHTHSGVLLSHKKNEILPSAATQMDPEIIILCEVSRTKTNIIWYNLYVESKMIQMNLQNRDRLHRLWKQIYGYQRWNVEGGIN